MIEGRDTLMGTYDAMVKRIYDLLPTDPECQRLFMKWKGEFRSIARTGRSPGVLEFRECSATYRDLILNLQLEGIEIYS